MTKISTALDKPNKIVKSIIEMAKSDTKSVDALVSTLEMVIIQLKMTVSEIKVAKAEKTA